MNMEIFSLHAFLFLLFPIISLYIFYHFFPSNKQASNSKINGFKLYPIVGGLPGFLANRHRTFDWITETLAKSPTNTALFYRPGDVSIVVTANPKNVEHMLKTNFSNYPKGERFISFLGDFLGDGIFNSDGEQWKLQRKTASHEFNTRSLRNFIMQNVFVEIQTRLVPVLDEASESGRVLDMQGVLERFAFDNFCKAAFNVDPGCLGGDGVVGAGDEFMRAFDVAAELSMGRFSYVLAHMWKIKKFLNIGSERRLRESISIVHKFADDIIKSRTDENEERERDDLLSRFLGTDGKSLEFLRDILISFILAGRDTTSSALSWFFWILSSTPEVQDNILNELGKIRDPNEKNFGDPYTFEELRDMQYLHAAITESMRLYPPVPSDWKACLNDDVMPDGTFVGKGWFVSYTNYAMGRMEGIWGKDCLEFRPERWLEDGIFRQESPFRYAVFHGGPRTCLGKDMAYIQMKAVVASVIERFQVVVEENDKPPQHVMSLTLRIKGGLPVTIKKREFTC